MSPAPSGVICNTAFTNIFRSIQIFKRGASFGKPAAVPVVLSIFLASREKS
jgi:hypothetical protein